MSQQNEAEAAKYANGEQYQRSLQPGQGVVLFKREDGSLVSQVIDRHTADIIGAVVTLGELLARDAGAQNAIVHRGKSRTTVALLAYAAASTGQFDTNDTERMLAFIDSPEGQETARRLSTPVLVLAENLLARSKADVNLPAAA